MSPAIGLHFLKGTLMQQSIDLLEDAQALASHGHERVHPCIVGNILMFKVY